MMQKIWQKKETDHQLCAEKVAAFTIGNDVLFDLRLAAFDVEASLAHAKMLYAVGLLQQEDAEALLSALEQIAEEIREGHFKIEEGVEDVHSQIEFLLISRIGEAGKKIHSGRSRNDQVLVCLKLYLRHEAGEISNLLSRLFHTLITLSDRHKDDLLPGYTHLQLAMPSSFGLWFAAYAESLLDDLDLLSAAYRLCNRNPLGSAAGYGTSFPLNRTMTTDLLGFERLHYNVVYAQMSRGKTEKTLAMAVAGIAATLSRFAYDLCLYLNQHFGFVSFPDALTTGSSIMPHKKNPDVFELIRARCNRLQALPNELSLLLNNLPSGYHRDLQLTKEILFPAIDTLKECLDMADFMMQYIEVKTDLLDNKAYSHLFTVESVNALVLKGLSFRDAYRTVGLAVEEGSYVPDKNLQHTHEGSMGNLCNDELLAEFQRVMAHFS